ncbi:MAG: hypothetical protein AB7N73_05395 [Gemmatimonadales bacterium]
MTPRHRHLMMLAGLLLGTTPASAQWPGQVEYREGREQLARGALDSAIATLSRYRVVYPDGHHAGETRYWEAFARYRRNTGDDLARAATLLGGPGADDLHPDAAALAARIAARRAAPSPAPAACRPDNGAAFAEILAAAGAGNRPDLETAARVALTSGSCPVVGRRAAVALLGGRATPVAREAVRGAVLRDAAPQVRSDALTQLVGDSAIATLRVAAHAVRRDSSRLVALTAADVLSRLAHRATADTLMAILVDPTVLATRQQAVLSWSRFAGRIRPTTAALRQAFPALATRGALGATVLEFVALHGDRQERDWIWAQVVNPSWPTMVRLTGLQQVGASRSIAELRALFDSGPPQLLRFGVLEQLRGHHDPAAVRALREIIASEAPGEVRDAARAALAVATRK